jgi:ABC-type antimicrobial peptide transport system permease subunit
MGIPLLQGREFTFSDTESGPKVGIINETMARLYFAGREPVGARFAFGAGNRVVPDIMIVGVVKDSKHTDVRDQIKPFVYIPYSQLKIVGNITFYVRTKQDIGAMAAVLRNEVQRLDPNLPVADLKTMQQQVDESLFADKFLTLLSMCFALLAALLASIGLYGVMAYTVTRRTREIGIRMALGATRGIISWLILREVVILALVGLVVGLPAAYGLGRFTESLLFGVKASDPLVFAGAGLLLTCATLLGAISLRAKPRALTRLWRSDTNEPILDFGFWILDYRSLIESNVSITLIQNRGARSASSAMKIQNPKSKGV